MDQCQRSRKTALPADKKDLPMTIGGQRWPGEWVFGVRPPQRGPGDGARITIRGKIKWPRLPLSLNYTCKPPLYRPLQHLRKRQSAPLSQPLAATLIAYWLSLLTTAGHRNNSHWPRCQESREGKDKKRRERVKRRERESWIRDRQQGKMCVFSFHYTGSLKRMGEEKNVLVRMGVSGGAGRRAGAIHRHSADKYGTPQNRAVHAWKQWLMNKQQDPRILLINKIIPLGAERDRRGMRQAEKSLLYANNMQEHMTIIVLAPNGPVGMDSYSISLVKSRLNPFSLQKKTIATNWGLISLPDCCTHIKGADQRQGEGTM